MWEKNGSPDNPTAYSDRPRKRGIARALDRITPCRARLRGCACTETRRNLVVSRINAWGCAGRVVALEVESCCAAWREAQKKEGLAGSCRSMDKREGGGELARSVVSEQRGTSGSYLYFVTQKSIWQKYRRGLLGSGGGSNDVTAVFVNTFGRQSLRSCVAPRRIYFRLSRRCRVADDRTLSAARSAACCV